MAKQKKPRKLEDIEQPKPKKEPKRTHAAYQVTFWLIIIGLIVQIVMAIVVFPSLPREIPSGWAGSATPYNSVPSWLVFLLFPGGQIVLLILAVCTPKDANGKRVMESGRAISLILLAILFTVLQASAFHIPRYGM